jgi:hypothetical protein
MTFQERFNKAVGTRTDRELARHLDVSIPSVRRWRDGTTSPHPLMVEFVFEKLGFPTDGDPS